MDLWQSVYGVATLVMFAVSRLLGVWTAARFAAGAGLGVVLWSRLHYTNIRRWRFASATVSGFITGCSVVLTPVDIMANIGGKR